MSYFQVRREIQALADANPQFKYLAQIHLTTMCNIIAEAECTKFCYQRFAQTPPMAFATFKDILQTYTPRQVAFGGGEPTLHPHFLKFILYAKLIARVKYVNYTTNACALPPHFDQVQEWIDGVSISMDNLRYPKLFSEGLPQVVHENLLRYMASPMQIVVNFVVNQTNLNQLEQILPIMKKYGLNMIYLLMYKDYKNFMHTDRITFRRAITQFLLKAYEQNIVVARDCCFASFESGENQCTAGKRFLAFRSDGVSMPCSFNAVIGDQLCPILARLDPPEDTIKKREKEPELTITNKNEH